MSRRGNDVTQRGRTEPQSERDRDSYRHHDGVRENVLRRKEACREAVEKCRPGRGAHTVEGGNAWYITGYNKNPYAK